MAAERTGQQRGSPPAVFLMGPTAAGKTGFAVELVERLPMQIISVDSALVYRGLDVGTAKPDPEVLARAPHRLIDIRDPQQPYSVAEFREDALAAMEEITAAGEVPLLVGGTMLYFRALTEGLSDLPAASGSIRRKLERQATEEGWPALHRRLAELDPRAASRIDPNDPQRIQRALEVIALSGRPMSALQRENRPEPLPYEVLKIVVCPAQRAALHRRIERRFEQMLERGFEQEVRRLHQTPGLHAGLPAMRAVGYRQAWAWLDGHLGPEEWPKRAVAATRQLAKRQLTWLRKERDALWYDFTADGARQAAFGAIGQFLKMAP